MAICARHSVGNALLFTGLQLVDGALSGLGIHCDGSQLDYSEIKRAIYLV